MQSIDLHAKVISSDDPAPKIPGKLAPSCMEWCANLPNQRLGKLRRTVTSKRILHMSPMKYPKDAAYILTTGPRLDASVLGNARPKVG